MTDDCLLCRAERVTEWHFEDDECWITDCMVCRTPMIVWRPHGLPDAEGERRMLARLERIARQRYPAGFWIDPERRRIPDHWHAHARPDGGFFDPASNLYGRYDRSSSQVPEAARQAEAVDTSTGHIGFRCIVRPNGSA